MSSSLITFSKHCINQFGTTVAGYHWTPLVTPVRGSRRFHFRHASPPPKRQTDPARIDDESRWRCLWNPVCGWGWGLSGGEWRAARVASTRRFFFSKNASLSAQSVTCTRVCKSQYRSSWWQKAQQSSPVALVPRHIIQIFLRGTGGVPGSDPECRLLQHRCTWNTSSRKSAGNDLSIRLISCCETKKNLKTNFFW